MESQKGASILPMVGGGIVFLIIVAAAYFYFASPSPPAEQSSDVGVQISGAVETPGEKIPETNPFKGYKNPFE